MSSSKVVAIIPARSGSKSIKDKNIELINGWPLLAFSIAVAKLSKRIDRVIISTDSEAYSEIGLALGAEVPFLRPKEISLDDSTDIQFFEHIISWFKEEGMVPDLIVHLRPTTPFREPKIIDKAIDFMEKNTKSSSLRSASKTHLTPYKMFSNNRGYMKPFLTKEDVKESYNLPRQYFEDAFIPNGYVDIVRPELIIRDKLLHGDNISLWETYPVPDIDTPQDLKEAQGLYLDSRFKPLFNYLEDL